ncbi:prolactin-releasing peptide receptor-like [Lycorma delicatula]|uniref:prolactin-releasing peptide receptor-like n=1 Tax=Lycorma delicatula TaxID=130591 RepID=UPI003F5189CE
MLTFVLIALDRHRFLQDPIKPRVPAFVCATGSWLMAICIVLPYPIYTTYIDLEKHINAQFKGVGICAVNLADDMQEYVRGLFIAMYVLPLAVIAYLYVKMSRELEDQDGPLAFMLYEARSQRNSHTPHHYREGQCESHFRYRSPTVNFDLYEAELDMRREKRTQKYLISMVTIFAICLCPLTVLRLAKLALTETYENSGHFDITFTMFVWIAFLPTCSTPILYASWRMSRSTKERLRGYFRLSNRHMRRSCEPPVVSAVPVGTVSSRANRESISNTSQQSSRFGGNSTPNTNDIMFGLDDDLAQLN